MNIHVSTLKATTAVTVEKPVKTTAKKKITPRQALEILGLPAGVSAASLDITALAVLHGKAIEMIGVVGDIERQVFRNTKGFIWEMMLRATAKTPAESALQLQTLLNHARTNMGGIAGMGTYCNDDELALIVDRLAILTAAAPNAAEAPSDFQAFSAQFCAQLPADAAVLIPLYRSYRALAEAALAQLWPLRERAPSVGDLIEEEFDRATNHACAIAVKLSELKSVPADWAQDYLETMVSHAVLAGEEPSELTETIAKAAALAQIA
jgi:hypothetical protein